MPDDFNMEADANQQAPLQEQAPQGTPDQLANLERQQRKAYWAGEEAASHRLPQFLPQDPLSGAVLQESERIEEEVWNAEVEAENMLLAAQENQVNRQSSQRELAQHALHLINQAGGELSPQALDDWVDFQAQSDPSIYDRPSYERKAFFYAWLRDMEDIAAGKKPQPRNYSSPRKTRDDAALDAHEKQQGRPSRPRDLGVDLANDNLPEGTELG